jgi:hypothetical protein
LGTKHEPDGPLAVVLSNRTAGCDGGATSRISMSVQHLSVPHLSVVPLETDTPAERARRLYAEAQEAALEQVGELETALEQVVELARSIAEGGDIYPSGIRELCRRTADETFGRRQTVQALSARRRGE